MKIINVSSQKPIVTIVNDRDVKFENSCKIDVITDEGTLSYAIKPGFITNGRSGPGIIDGFVPHFGDHDTFIAWIVHDCNYYELLSKKLADELLMLMLINAGMSKFKAFLVKKSVEWFGNNAFGINTNEDENMRRYISFEFCSLKPGRSKHDNKKE